MAIAAKRPDEVLRWFDKMRSEHQRPGSYNSPLGDTDRVAVAVSAVYPERALEIYLAKAGGGERQTTRRCEDCNLFTRRLGPGGECQHCGEPVPASELLEVAP